MTRQEAEALVGSRVTAWTAANGTYVGTLVRVLPTRPWRGVVHIDGVLSCATAWERGRLNQRRGLGLGRDIEVGGSSIRPAPANVVGTSYLEALQIDLAQLQARVHDPLQVRDLWWINPSIQARRQQIADLSTILTAPPDGAGGAQPSESTPHA